MPKTAVLVARDTGGCQMIAHVGDELENRGWDISRFLGYGREIPFWREDLPHTLLDADCLLVGRSVPKENAEPELLALHSALSYSPPVPCFMASDGWVSMLPWFKPFYQLLDGFFVLNQYCADEVRMQFSTLNVIASGDPEWEKFFTPAFNRGQVRRFLGDQLNISPNEVVIIAGGVRDLVINVLFWGAVVEAMKKYQNIDVTILACMHPGDETDTKPYHDLCAACPTKMFLIDRDLSKQETRFRTSNLLPGCDLFLGSYLLVGDEAACQRIPVISYFTEPALHFLESLQGHLPKERRRVWPPCEAKCARAIYGNPHELAGAIEDMLTPSGFAPWKQRQEKFYAPPAPGSAAKTMADEIERVVGSR